MRSPAIRRRYWARSLVGWERFRSARPGPAHTALAELEARGAVTAVITQNVDGLHQAAGSARVLELHGSLAEVACLACGEREPRDELQVRLRAANPGLAGDGAATAPDGDADLPDALVDGFMVPGCRRCDGVLKPRVVFFGDSVPRPIVERAFDEVDRADVLLVAGTSLTVFSGYRFLLRASQRPIPIAIVNRGVVRGEERASCRVDGGTGETLSAVARLLRS